jgi:hypothetical protein
LVRFGLLAWVFAFTFDIFFRGLLPLASDYPAWYAEPILVYLIVIAGFVLFGFYNCLAGRSLFGRGVLDRPVR